MLIWRRCVYQFTCSDHAAPPLPSLHTPPHTSPLLLRIAESDFRAQISNTICFFCFLKAIVLILHPVVDGKFRESPIINKRLIFIILRIFFVFVIIVTVNFHAVQDECA